MVITATNLEDKGVSRRCGKDTVATRWDEKAGLRMGCYTLPSYRRAQGTDKKETGNEKG